MNWIKLIAITLLFIVPFATAEPQTSQTQSTQSASVRVETDVPVAMRDGVPLGVDLYFPEGKGPFPTLLELTPYNKKSEAKISRYFASHGYVVAVADSRGLNASKGKWSPYINEARDGYDLQQWIGSQSWCDGKVGMFGSSYPGFTQLLPAPLRSPYVKALIPASNQVDNFSFWSTDGLLKLAFSPAWASREEAIATGQAMPEVNWTRLFWHLPLESIPEQIGVRSPFLVDVIKHERHDEFWKPMSLLDRFGEMDVPALHVSGWYDDLLEQVLLAYTEMRKKSRSDHARQFQKLLIGPWGHGGHLDPQPQYGDMILGPDAGLNFPAMELRWFDYLLKGIDNGLDKEAPVRIFVMGANKWRDEAEWPLARARETPYYLHSAGFANTRSGDGTLSPTLPSSEPSDRYRYDPESPVPTYGGHGCCTTDIAPMGPLDQRATEERPDVLVYTTAPLEEDTEVTGPITLHLFFSTDVVDTDFFATLSDVFPDCRAILITDGQLRTRFRESLERTVLLKPGKEYEVTIRLWGTSNLFKKGHRIRLHLTSSNFPRFNRNLNSGKPRAEEVKIHVAHQIIWHDAAHPSSIVLPIVR